MLTLDDRPIAGVREEPLRASSLPHVGGEEFVNAVTHGIGLAVSIAGATVLIDRAAIHGGAWRMAGCGIFAATLVAMYAASTASHLFAETRLRRLFRSLDQASITC